MLTTGVAMVMHEMVVRKKEHVFVKDDITGNIDPVSRNM
jgi:hypothetical protein